MLLALPFVIFSVVLAAQANIAHGAQGVSRRHPVRLSQPRAPLETPKNLKKRKSCKAPTTSKTTAKATSAIHTTTSTKKTTTTTKKAATTPVAQIAVAGVLKVTDNACGPNGATTKISSSAGPNGAEEWLNCGITGSGWKPPYLGTKDIISKDLASAIKDSNSPFKACAAYVSLFEKHAAEHGLPPIMLASFAMQESSCNKDTVGGNGEQGLMQITQDKCGGAPGGNCRDPDFNIKTAASYFANTLNDNGGNLLLTIGQYNGWDVGLTAKKATSVRYSDCLAQQNLDYLHQFLNGWMQNVDAYSAGLGTFHNLDVCPGKK
ncbi:glycoside hydrolase family 23 protein [Mycena metata]|uniref:Glycoside hydrolase family 23 protein n=1 Tax=Mycena metata TaxID=1033252 RepID=A0AAD7INT9_9AGAR|nr:glycoside hydrolase family 23 protein [Mycena metata]